MAPSKRQEPQRKRDQNRTKRDVDASTLDGVTSGERDLFRDEGNADVASRIGIDEGKGISGGWHSGVKDVDEFEEGHRDRPRNQRH